MKAEFPEMLLCLSTNGLMLPDRVDELASLGMHSLTVTINAVDPVMARGVNIPRHSRGITQMNFFY